MDYCYRSWEDSIISELQSANKSSIFTGGIYRRFFFRLYPFTRFVNTPPAHPYDPNHIQYLSKKYSSFLHRSLSILPDILTETPNMSKEFAMELLDVYRLCIDCLDVIAPDLGNLHASLDHRYYYICCLRHWKKYDEAKSECKLVLEKFHTSMYETFGFEREDDKGNNCFGMDVESSNAGENSKDDTSTLSGNILKDCEHQLQNKEMELYQLISNPGATDSFGCVIEDQETEEDEIQETDATDKCTESCVKTSFENIITSLTLENLQNEVLDGDNEIIDSVENIENVVHPSEVTDYDELKETPQISSGAGVSELMIDDSANDPVGFECMEARTSGVDVGSCGLEQVVGEKWEFSFCQIEVSEVPEANGNSSTDNCIKSCVESLTENKLGRGQRDKVQQLVTITRSSEKVTIQALKSSDRQIQGVSDFFYKLLQFKSSADTRHSDELDNRYKDSYADMILADGITLLCNDLQVDPKDIVTLVISWNMRAATTGEFSKRELIGGLQLFGIDSLEKFRGRIPFMRFELKDDHKFREIYNFAFVWAIEIEKGLMLCQILRIAKLNFVDFFNQLNQLVIKVGSTLRDLYGADWEKRLESKESQISFVDLALLSKHCKRAYQQFLFKVDKNDDNISNFYRFGWLLVLAMRTHVFCHFKDLVTCTNGLVSTLVILIIHVSARFRNFNLDDSELLVMKGDKFDIPASLCKVYETSEDELKKTLEKTNNLITDVLKLKSSSTSKSKPKNLENIVTDGLVYFEELMGKSSFSSSITLLEKDYDVSIQNKGYLDKRIFLNEDEKLYQSLGFGLWGIVVSGNNYAIIGTKSGKLEIIDVRSSTCLEVVEAHSGLIMSIAANPDGFITGSTDHYVKFLEYNMKRKPGQDSKSLTVSPVSELKMNEDGNVIAISPDGKHMRNMHTWAKNKRLYPEIPLSCCIKIWDPGIGIKDS